MNTLLFNLGGSSPRADAAVQMPAEAVVEAVVAATGATRGELDTRRFPDGEVYVRVASPCAGANVILCAGLQPPDETTLRVLLTAATLRDLGAARVLLVAPYLPYMRQDSRFREGEGITSRYYAGLLSAQFDGLVTVDPHLHRYAALSELYTVPAVCVHAAPAIGAWVRENVSQPVLIGPDSESRQWVEAVAAVAAAPFIVLEKVRRGDRDVSVSEPDLLAHDGRQPVILDDIISSGRTMAEAVARVNGRGGPQPVCIAVHPVFADGAVADLRAAGAGRVVSCNTIAHDTNAIDVSPLIGAACRGFLGDTVRHAIGT
ncbi:ribose-phosphate diphosphokinase [Lentisalinibacter salinarum]|uniref:ribose-phosphate diphosphokinase n=1 Tax=Lentisalinibacter salinarum TaxID=2992239 RepID=UPI00386767BB